MDKMVNSPGHYLREGHPQCIELMEKILVGYRGVAAFDIGQIKYVYRFGDKPEKGMTRKQKAIQDVNKFGWYVDDFDNRARNLARVETITLDTQLPVGYRSDRPYYDANEVEFIANEFADDKKEEYKAIVKSIVNWAYHLYTFQDVYDLRAAVARLSNAIKENEPEE